MFPTTSKNTTIGDLITLIYPSSVAEYGEGELAALATAATINDLLVRQIATPMTTAQKMLQAAARLDRQNARADRKRSLVDTAETLLEAA